MAEVAARATETAAVEVGEGESLGEIKAKLKPKKRGACQHICWIRKHMC